MFVTCFRFLTESKRPLGLIKICENYVQKRFPRVVEISLQSPDRLRTSLPTLKCWKLSSGAMKGLEIALLRPGSTPLKVSTDFANKSI